MVVDLIGCILYEGIGYSSYVFMLKTQNLFFFYLEMKKDQYLKFQYFWLDQNINVTDSDTESTNGSYTIGQLVGLKTN